MRIRVLVIQGTMQWNSFKMCFYFIANATSAMLKVIPITLEKQSFDVN